MKAVVLAAGKGERMLPLTETRPKHMIKICGKPLLEHLLLSIKEVGIEEVLLVVHYMKEQIAEYFGDGKEIKMRLSYAEQEGVLGTANAVSLAKNFVGDEPFLLIYGDLVVHASEIKKVLEAFKEKDKPIMGVVPTEHPERYGVVEVDESGKVLDVVEKPSKEEAPSNLANAGIYVLTDKIFPLLENVPKSERGEYEITDALRSLAREEGMYVAQLDHDKWLDVGRPWDLFAATKIILDSMEPSLDGFIEEGATLTGKVVVEKGAIVRSGAYIEGPCFIGSGSDIGPNCYIRPYTSIGRGVRIGNAVEIKNSVIMDNSHIAHLSYVGDSVIGENCNLGAGTITANLRLDERTVKMVVKGELVDSGRRKLGAILGDGVKTGIHVSFMPGVKVGSGAWIGPNVVVYRDVESGTFVLSQQELTKKKVPS